MFLLALGTGYVCVRVCVYMIGIISRVTFPSVKLYSVISKCMSMYDVILSIYSLEYIINILEQMKHYISSQERINCEMTMFQLQHCCCYHLMMKNNVTFLFLVCCFFCFVHINLLCSEVEWRFRHNIWKYEISWKYFSCLDFFAVVAFHGCHEFLVRSCSIFRNYFEFGNVFLELFVLGYACKVIEAVSSLFGLMR